MQTWSFGAQSNNEAILSAVPAVLALLLKSISSILELSEYGLRLGRTLLQKRQQELIARGLTTQKGKEFVISPALRLLKEVTIFDGGTLAQQVFRSREQLFKNMVRNLNLRLSGDAVETQFKPSIRTHTLRFLLSLIRLLPTEEKSELLHQRDVMTGITKDIVDDPPFVVREIMETLRTHVLKDEAVPRSAKTKVVNAGSLARIAMLYRYDQAEEEPLSDQKPVDVVAHEFLMLACTSQELGVLNRQNGFYPRGIDPDESQDPNAGDDIIDLGLEGIEWMDSFTEKVPVRNTILSDFCQNLRPWANIKQNELLLAIFKSAPELVADFFFGKKAFAFDPKLTATWVGYSAFLFSAIQLPLPSFFGHQGRYARLPPPTSVVLESIIPLPLTCKVLTRCLNLTHNMITFFALRLLCISIAKLKQALKMYQEAATGSSSLWKQAADRLTDEFCKRCPSIKDVIATFRRIPASDLLQREAATRLLNLYYEVIPRIALDAKFDVSGVLAQSLEEVKTLASPGGDGAMRSMVLENIFQFAHYSPGTRWFAKVDGSSISPFMVMLKLSAEASPELPLLKLRSVLGSLLEENQILQTKTSVPALETLVSRLRELDGVAHKSEVYEFLDDCISRCAARSMKYIIAFEKFGQEAHDSSEEGCLVSLMTFALLEQWPFVLKSVSPEISQDIAQFLGRYLASSIKIGEDKKILKAVAKKLAADTPENAIARKAIEEYRKLELVVAEPPSLLAHTEPAADKFALQIQERLNIQTEAAEEFENYKEDPTALVKWAFKEIEEVIQGGLAADLLLLLSSEHLHVRKEAVTNTLKLATKLKQSTYEEKEQIWLLLSEVAETAKLVVNTGPLPMVLARFASHAIAVLDNPLHFLYPKINKFLSKGPVWDLAKIPLMYKILDESPELDDAYYQETEWILTCMILGLRTPVDLSIYRKNRVFEKLFSMYNNTYLAPGLREKIVKLLFRATSIEGGSTTLVVRFSSISWLQAQVALGKGGIQLKALLEKILETCDKEHVGNWSKKGVEQVKVDTMKF